MREGINHFFGITGVQLFLNKLKSVSRVSVDATLNRFQHKGIWAGRKPTQNICEFRVAQLIGTMEVVMPSFSVWFIVFTFRCC